MFSRISQTDLLALLDLKRQARIPNRYRLDDAKVCYVHDGNFTTALVAWPNGKLQVGTAKRNPADAQHEEVGNRVALVRAFRSGDVYAS